MICDDVSAIIFDLDGTLVDSAPDLAAGVAHALSGTGQPAPSLDEVRAYIGEGAARLVHRALTGELDGVADDVVFQRVSDSFFEFYAANICEHSRLYPNVKSTLSELQVRGYSLACATNKPARFTLPLLEALNIDTFFPVCVSGDTLPQKKPDPAPLLFAADGLGVPAANCAMIGDTAIDVIAARAAGMPVIAVDYGYGSRQAIEQAAPDRVVSAIGELAEYLPPLLVAS